MPLNISYSILKDLFFTTMFADNTVYYAVKLWGSINVYPKSTHLKKETARACYTTLY